jgi:hypothetical protein
MLRPVHSSQDLLNHLRSLSGPDTQIITGEASITSQKRESNPHGRSATGSDGFSLMGVP